MHGHHYFRGGGHLLALFGTRPELIKLAPVVEACRARGVAVTTVATGQHPDLLGMTEASLGIAAGRRLLLDRRSGGLDGLMSGLVAGIGHALDDHAPDMLMVQGDTASAFAGALAAFHRRLPIAHVEAGLRTGDLGGPHPEEGYRRLIAPLADIHFAPTNAAVRALVAEGIDPARIHLTGNSGIDAVMRMKARLDADPSPAAALDRMVDRFAGRHILLVTAHRREALDGGIGRIADAAARLALRPDVALLVILHPNNAAAGPLQGALSGRDNVALLPPLDPLSFVRAMDRATLILTDSGGVQEEAPALGTPVLVLRNETERPEGIAAGAARLVGTDSDRIYAEAARLLDDREARAAMAVPRFPFGLPGAGERIARVLASRLAQPRLSVAASIRPATACTAP